MSRLFEALSGLQSERRPRKIVARATAGEIFPAEPAAPEVSAGETAQVAETENRPSPELRVTTVPPNVPAANAEAPEFTPAAIELPEALPIRAETLGSRLGYRKVSSESRFVALTDPDSLGAEKFRALVARLDDLRKQRELSSFQVTSSTVCEGKTLVAGNVAVTLARYSGSRTLLIEGDLRRPALTAQLGLSGLRGLSDWWSGRDPELAPFIQQFNDMPLWLLPAGEPCDRPSDLLRSARLAKAFTKLASQFEWIVVDSTPMLPIVDVNLWSKLVDGTLLVVREGITPVKALKKGLLALDHPKLIGVVINDASESGQDNYEGQYYGAGKAVAGQAGKMI